LHYTNIFLDVERKPNAFLINPHVFKFNRDKLTLCYHNNHMGCKSYVFIKFVLPQCKSHFHMKSSDFINKVLVTDSCKLTFTCGISNNFTIKIYVTFILSAVFKFWMNWLMCWQLWISNNHVETYMSYDWVSTI